MATKTSTNLPAVSLYTLGCRLNQSESAVIKNSLSSLGFKFVGKGQPADVMVINTCTVTAQGDKDTQRLISRLLRINPQAKIALIGCQSQIQKGQLSDWPGVHWVVGNERKFELAAILQESVEDANTKVIVPEISREDFSVPFSSADRTRTRVNIKIQDGCDYFCSFCEVPYARGRSRSRIFGEIIDEINALVRLGYQEIVLTGINIACYSYQKKNLIDLLDELEQIKGLQRIRISSLEMTSLCRDIISRIKQSTKICRHLHIPTQSLSDGVLKRMKRRHSSQEFLDLAQWAVKQIPELCLGTDIIVGFPGETAEEFAEGLDKLKKAAVNYLHVFSYSRRRLAKSRDLPGHLAATIIKKRSVLCHQEGTRKREIFFRQMTGHTAKVLFEQRKNGLWTGLTDHYIRVKVDFPEHLANQIRKVRLKAAAGQFMMAELIEPNEGKTYDR